MTYFLSYKRALLYADQKEYISQGMDSAINILAFFIKYSVIYYFKKFALYLFIQVIQTVVSNLLISGYCKRHYSFLGLGKFDKKIFFAVFRDVKNVFAGKIAGFIYGATDNLVISTFLGTVQVGYLSNYMIFMTAIKQAVNALFCNMTSIIGHLLNEKQYLGKQEEKFRIYAYFRYLLATIIVIPWILLSDYLIQFFFGIEYIMGENIGILLAMDLYIHIVYSLCCEYINGSGNFRYDRNIAISGAVLNLVSSIFFVEKIGVAGVLIGTVISQIFFWILRSLCVYNKVFQAEKSEYLKYIAENIFWIMCVWLVVAISRNINSIFSKTNLIASMIRIFIICELVNLLVQTIILCFSDKRKLIQQVVTNGRRVNDDSC